MSTNDPPDTTAPTLTFSGCNAPMAEWNIATDTVTFNWPAIEQAAADARTSLQGIAKILLAAREAGRPGFVA